MAFFCSVMLFSSRKGSSPHYSRTAALANPVLAHF